MPFWLLLVCIFVGSGLLAFAAGQVADILGAALIRRASERDLRMLSQQSLERLQDLHDFYNPKES